MGNVRKDVEYTIRILKREFLFLNHAPEQIENAIMTCADLRNWLHDYDGWDDWEGRVVLLVEEGVMVEYDPCNEENVFY